MAGEVVHDEVRRWLDNDVGMLDTEMSEPG